MKYLILVGDGMGDLPVPELNGQTPLEAASTPAMDFLASHGRFFQLRTIPAGMAPGSDVANLSLLGYRPETFYTGRAPLEAASMGIDLADNEIACRCNLVTMDREDNGLVTMVDYSAGHISTPEAHAIIRDLQQAFGSATFHFHPGISYRHLLIHTGELSGLATVPPHDYPNGDVTEFWQRYRAFPQLATLLDGACKLLETHPVNLARHNEGKRPANGIWLWGEGKAPVMPTIRDQFGLSGALISAVDLLKGIGVYGGLEIIKVPGATGYLDTNYAGKADAAINALQRHDLVFVHVEAPDETGHQGLVREKIQAIEDFDQKIVQPIIDAAGNGCRVALAMDHFTPLSLKTHVDRAVPIVLCDLPVASPSRSRRYTEANGSSLGSMLSNGRQFFDALLAGRSG